MDDPPVEPVAPPEPVEPVAPPDPDVPPELEPPESTETKVDPTMKIRLSPESDGSETSWVAPEIADASCFAAGSLPGAYSISLVV